MFGSDSKPAREKSCSTLALWGMWNAVCLKTIRWSGMRSQRLANSLSNPSSAYCIQSVLRVRFGVTSYLHRRRITCVLGWDDLNTCINTRITAQNEYEWISIQHVHCRVPTLALTRHGVGNPNRYIQLFMNTWINHDNFAPWLFILMRGGGSDYSYSW